MAQDREYVFIDSDFSKSYRDAIRAEFDWPTFPIIVHVDREAETLVGGYEELQSLLQDADEAPT